MNDNYDSWELESQGWRDELDRKLQVHGGSDVVAPYRGVAFAFPSAAPNPRSFDYPAIDYDRLKQWADSEGWEVKLAPELVSGASKAEPPIRFIRK